MKQLKIIKQVTNREGKSLNKYLQDISKIGLLTAEEEVELAREIKQGNQESLDKLVCANLRFVVSVAKQYQDQGLDLPDLINEGNWGLVKAARRFDDTRGFKFISYAVWWIRQGIMQALAEQSRIVRLPLNKIGNINKVNKAVNRLEQNLQRKPSVEEIAIELDMTITDAEQCFRIMGKHISMDAPLIEGENSSLYDICYNEDGSSTDQILTLESLRIEIKKALGTLSFREANIIKLFYGLEGKESMTLTEISETICLTRERVRQIKEKAIRRLKARSNELKIYLG